jgi:hypothetical protein
MAVDPRPMPVFSTLTTTLLNQEIDRTIRVASNGYAINPKKSGGQPLRNLLRNIVAFANQGGTGTGGAGPLNEVLTIQELVTLKNTNGLIPGDRYKFPYKPVQYVETLNTILVHPVEYLIATAKTDDSFHENVSSISYPEDTILMDLENTYTFTSVSFNSSAHGFSFAGANSYFGRIYYRKCGLRFNETFGYDFRAFKFPRWKIPYSTYAAATTYTLGSIVLYQNALWISIWRDPNNPANITHSGKTPNDLSINSYYWARVYDGANLAEVAYCAAASEIFILGQSVVCNPTDYKFYYTFNSMGRNATTTSHDVGYFTNNFIRENTIRSKSQEFATTGIFDAEFYTGANNVIKVGGLGDNVLNNQFDEGVIYNTISGSTDEFSGNIYTNNTAMMVQFGGSANNILTGAQVSFIGSNSASNRYEISDAVIGKSCFFNNFKSAHTLGIQSINSFIELEDCGGVLLAANCGRNRFLQSNDLTLNYGSSGNRFTGCSFVVLGQDSTGNTFDSIELKAGNFCSGNLIRNFTTCTAGSNFRNNFILRADTTNFGSSFIGNTGTANINSINFLGTNTNNRFFSNLTNCYISATNSEISGTLTNAGSTTNPLRLSSSRLYGNSTGVVVTGVFLITNTSIQTSLSGRTISGNVTGANIIDTPAGGAKALSVTGSTLNVLTISQIS